MLVALAKVALWGGLTAAYARPQMLLDHIDPLTADFLPYISDGNLGVIGIRLVLTLLAMTQAFARTSTLYLPLVTLFVVANAVSVHAIVLEKSYDILPWELPLQMVFFDFVATLSFSAILAIAYFTPRPATARQQYRSQLVDFYKQYNPSKLNEVDTILRRYRFHEEVLFTRLKKKYIEKDATETVEDEDSDEEKPTTSRSTYAPKTLARKHDEVKEDEDLEPEGTPPPPDSPQGRADTKPKVQTAIEEVRAAQMERVEQRIRKMGKKK
ncbi:Aste57867_3967 [Aphanomyces stellatus]|uniref:Aste57867_3967 protein n=1 Tax=Aphanomyces stellatus TaxID=120398 RepID=A0A485KF41_9STRA|nr:hypothetical protein As57867_003956 [Aphanomyces stellatus]VFT81104.1 Aste57867_3967 [Aphanomyces stellatus]